MNWEAQNKIALFFDSKQLLSIDRKEFCLLKNLSNPIATSTCKNGHYLYDSNAERTTVSNKTVRFICMCIKGYLGAACDAISPCFVTSNVTIQQREVVVLKNSFTCMNEGMCVAKLASAPHYIKTGQRHVASCMCRPQYTGESCDRNRDSCAFPFLWKDKFHNKCVVNSTDGSAWCARDSQNFEKDGRAASCQSLPCKTPFKYQGNFYFEKCLYRKFPEFNNTERAFCSLSRNYDLYKSWRFCEEDDLTLK
jgi:hypothetical protein